MAFEFDKRVSWGNIVTVSVLVVGLVAGWTSMKAATERAEADILRLQADTDRRIKAFEETARAYEGRIRAVEIAQASQSSDLRSIQQGINEIKEQLRRLGGPHR